MPISPEQKEGVYFEGVFYEAGGFEDQSEPDPDEILDEIFDVAFAARVDQLTREGKFPGREGFKETPWPEFADKYGSIVVQMYKETLQDLGLPLTGLLEKEEWWQKQATVLLWLGAQTTTKEIKEREAG